MQPLPVMIGHTLGLVCKIAVKLIDMAYPVYYHKNTEGDYGGSSTNEQRAKLDALTSVPTKKNCCFNWAGKFLLSQKLPTINLGT